MTDPDLLAYLRQRDARRRRAWDHAIVVLMIAAAIALMVLVATGVIG